MQPLASYAKYRSNGIGEQLRAPRRQDAKVPAAIEARTDKPRPPDELAYQGDPSLAQQAPNNHMTVTILNSYIRPGATRNESRKLLLAIEQRIKRWSKLLMIGDVNPSSELWGPCHLDDTGKANKSAGHHLVKITRGRAIELFANKHRLQALKYGKCRPTFGPTGAYVDVMLAGEKCFRIWKSCSILEPSRALREPQQVSALAHGHRLLKINSHQVNNSKSDSNSSAGASSMAPSSRHVRKYQIDKIHPDDFIELRLQASKLINKWRMLDRDAAINRLEGLVDTTMGAIKLAQDATIRITRTNRRKATSCTDMTKQIIKYGAKLDQLGNRLRRIKNGRRQASN